jgi:predicted ATP-grasp superfamily ATP-dependent carboligase
MSEAFRYIGDSSFPSPILVIPTVSTGNLGQLAVDLFVSSNAVRLGYFLSDFVIPAVGCDALACDDESLTGTLTFPLELYYSIRYSICFFQQRTPLLDGSQRLFASHLIDWATSAGFQFIICLSSSESFHRSDALLSDEMLNFRICWNREIEKIEEKLVKAVESCTVKTLNTSDLIQTTLLTEPDAAGGLSSLLLSSSLLVLNFLSFTSDSDNSAEAIYLATRLHQLFSQIVNSGTFSTLKHVEGNPEFRIPLAWRSTLGGPPAREIYL